MKFLLLILLILLILPFIISLTACDTFSHIRRDDVFLTGFPAKTCIEDVLKTTSGIEFNSYETSESKKWLGHDNDYVPNQYYYYSILADSKKFLTAIVLAPDKDGKIKYSNAYTKLGRHLTDDEKRVIPPVLAHVDAEISKACGVKMNSTLHLSE